MNALTRWTVLLYLGLDVLFGPLVTFAYVQLIGPKHPWQCGLILGGLLLCKMGACFAFILRALRPVEVFESSEAEKQRDVSVAGADASLQSFPSGITLCYSGSWVVVLAMAYAILFVRGEYDALPDGTGWTTLFVIVSVMFGAAALAFPSALLLAARSAGQCSIYARDRGVLLERRPVRIQSRVGLM